MAKFFKADYSGGKKNSFLKLEDGDNVYRVLPSLDESGKWKVYHKVEWGYSGTDGQLKPFQCARHENFKTKMVEIECAACLHREQIEQEVKEKGEELKSLLLSKKITRDEMASEVEKLKKLTQKFNLDKKFYINVMDLNGSIGVLKVPYKAMLDLDTEINKLRDQGIDPLSLEQGRFFVFSKTGKNRDTLYKVSTYSEMVEIPGHGRFPKVKESIISEAEAERIAGQCKNLYTLYPQLTDEQVDFLVNGGPEAVDAVFQDEAKPKPSSRIVAEVKKPLASIEESVADSILSSMNDNDIDEDVQGFMATPISEIGFHKGKEVSAPVQNAAPKFTAKPLEKKEEAKKASLSQSEEDFLKSLEMGL